MKSYHTINIGGGGERGGEGEGGGGEKGGGEGGGERGGGGERRGKGEGEGGQISVNTAITAKHVLNTEPRRDKSTGTNRRHTKIRAA